MTLELYRRQTLRYLHKKTVCNIPLIHALIVLLELLVMSRLIAKFNSIYEKRPLLTMMVSNAVLGGLADTTAQLITAIRENSLRKIGGPNPIDDPVATEIHELDKVVHPEGTELVPDAETLPPPFDLPRLSRFMAYGFCMAPLQFKWFQFLSKAFPISKGISSGVALQQTAKRVSMDQLIFAPLGLGVFFTAMTLAEGGGTTQVQHKLRDMYLPSLKANYVIWPAVQLINFRLMPVQFQLPFVSTVGIAWTAYLSLSNAAADVKESHDTPNSRSVPSSPQIRL